MEHLYRCHDNFEKDSVVVNNIHDIKDLLLVTQVEPQRKSHVVCKENPMIVIFDEP
jgi:hypothetical protein